MSMDQLELEIEEWRTFVEQSPAVDGRDLEELEDHLRDQIADLMEAGLTADEAFLIAVKRLGSIDELSREFAARTVGGSGASSLSPGPATSSSPGAGGATRWCSPLRPRSRSKSRSLAAGIPPQQSSWLLRNASLLVLPFLAGYFAARRRLSWNQILVTAAPFVIAALVINVYPFIDGGSTELLRRHICRSSCGSSSPIPT